MSTNIKRDHGVFSGLSPRKTVSFGKVATSAALASLLLMLSAPVLAGSVSYVYDTLGRVTQIKYSNGATIKYLYDAAGNRTSQVTTGAP